MAMILRRMCGPRTIQAVIPRLSQCRQISSDDFKSDSDKKEKPHPEASQVPSEPQKGKIYDKKPFKIELKADKNYHWCACGTSKNQPLCDGSHKQLEKMTGYKWQPLRFQVEKEKEYWLCNCKQTEKAPFCDGTHKQPHIQAAIR